jgi:tryptophanyl-tRNA synthetase
MAQNDKSTELKQEQNQGVTAYSVDNNGPIDYHKLLNSFGCNPIDGKLIERFERVTKTKAHPWLRRGLFFSHRELDKALDNFEAKKSLYIYTGRGPSSEAMHLGHMIPFDFTVYLQKAFSAVVIIQLSDNEKFFFKGGSLEEYSRLGYENAKDIIARGFDIKKTWIFLDSETVGGEYYKNIVRLQKLINGNQVRGTFGFNLDNNIGQLSWVCNQSAPAFSNSFPDIFGEKHIYCLVPMAIDQQAFFRQARECAEKLKNQGYLKPSEIHAKFLPALKGSAKMSSTGNDETDAPIFMTDTSKEISKKIMRSFSGGQDTKEFMLFLT